MGESSTSAAMCKVCGYRHRQGDPHNWGTESKSDRKSIIETLKEDVSRVHNNLKKPVERVHNTPESAKERVHNPEKAKDVYTIRQVSIRQLRANLAGELRNLPFDIVKSGIVIANVGAKANDS